MTSRKDLLFTPTAWYLWLVHTFVVWGLVALGLFLATQWYGEQVTILIPRIAQELVHKGK